MEKLIKVDATFIFHGTIKVRAEKKKEAIEIIQNGFTIQIVTGDRCDDDIVDWDINIKPIKQKLK